MMRAQMMNSTALAAQVSKGSLSTSTDENPMLLSKLWHLGSVLSSSASIHQMGDATVTNPGMLPVVFKF